MKTKNNIRHESPLGWFLLNIKMSIGLVLIASIGILTPTMAQDAEYTKPAFRVGLAGGANFNYYRGTTQSLNRRVMSPAAFRHGDGVGLFLAPLLEYHNPNSPFGAFVQLGYDSRKGVFDQVLSACNCPLDLSTKLSYISIEPNLRFSPIGSDFYMFAGPRIGVVSNKSFIFQHGVNPASPSSVTPEITKGNFNEMKNTVLSMQVGVGYDIPLSTQNQSAQFILSPFASFHPYFGQQPRNIENWSLTTFRVGAALKLGFGAKIPKARETVVTPPATASVADVRFSVASPENLTTEIRVRETFPLRNYIFFDPSSSAIPSRYILLTKAQVSDFKEDQLESSAQVINANRPIKGMFIYHNILNILGDRMGKNPSANITLVGSSINGPANGRLMAESVKKYLVDIFGIAPNRIAIEGRDKPKIPSEQIGGTRELELLREGDQRVSIESSSNAILMEFQPGPDGPIKPVQFTTVAEAPVDSYVTFNAVGSNAAYDSWSLELRDPNGSLQNFGPYTRESVSIPGKSILGTKKSEDYTVTMVGKAKNGSVVRKETSTKVVLWKTGEVVEAQRYSILFEFNDSKTISMYQKYLTDIVAANIPAGANVIIRGYTDVIGDFDNNKKLSEQRAMEVRNILSAEVNRLGRSNVKFDVRGLGEDENISPFGNRLPEERFYNRTVLIDIIPAN
jgi:outer membrane protein OmpA-like peptidoglycan-associated protein